MFEQSHFIVTLFIVKIGIPPYAFHTYKLIAILIYSASSRIQGIVFGDTKFPVTAMDTASKPYSIIF